MATPDTCPYDKMSVEYQNELVKKLGECIAKHGFENDIKVTKYRETVCALAQGTVDDKQLLKIEKQFSPDRKEAVAAFKADAE